MENILVPVCRHSPDLNSLYHSFALAERVKAKVFVLFFKENETNPATAVERACSKIVNSACEDGIAVSYHIAGPSLKKLQVFIRAERIQMVIIGSGDKRIESVFTQIRPAVRVRIIKVKVKTHKTPQS